MSDTSSCENLVFLFFLSHILVIVVCDRSSDVIELSEDLSHTTMTKICERKKTFLSKCFVSDLLIQLLFSGKQWLFPFQVFLNDILFCQVCKNKIFTLLSIVSSHCLWQCELLLSRGVSRLMSVNFSHFNLLLRNA